MAGVNRKRDRRPSEAAADRQVGVTGPARDRFADRFLYEGNLIFTLEYQGAGPVGDGKAESGFGTTLTAVMACGGDQAVLEEGLQIRAGGGEGGEDSPALRLKLTAWEISEGPPIPAAFGYCEANKQHGPGGYPLYFIPDFGLRRKEERIRRRPDLDRTLDPTGKSKEPGWGQEESLSAAPEPPAGAKFLPYQGPTPFLGGQSAGPGPEQPGQGKKPDREAEQSFLEEGKDITEGKTSGSAEEAALNFFEGKMAEVVEDRAREAVVEQLPGGVAGEILKSAGERILESAEVEFEKRKEQWEGETKGKESRSESNSSLVTPGEREEQSEEFDYYNGMFL